MGILGHNREYKPRFGLYIDTSPECRGAIEGLLAEGYDADVCLKYGLRCSKHEHLPHRPVMALSAYLAAWDAGELEDSDANGCYIREVFFTETLNLRRYNGNQVTLAYIENIYSEPKDARP